MSNTPRIFTSTTDQIFIQAGRGMIISHDETTRRIIEAENYYKLFNGYKELFLDKTMTNEVYLPGTKFEEVYALYLFDRELRNLYIRYILEIENNIKSVLAHEFSKKYGHENYLIVSNFDTMIKSGEKKSKAQKVGEISDLIANLQHEIARQLSKNNPMISHYMLEYGYVPLWVLVNTLTLGTLSVFYSLMKQQDQNNVGRFFSLKPDELRTILQVLSLYRNACAHDERLYNLKSMNRRMRPNNIKALPLHIKLGIPKNKGNNYICGVNDLFAVTIIFKTMLSKKSFDTFYNEIDLLMSDLANKLHTISIVKVEVEMGFISNWRNIKNCI